MPARLTALVETYLLAKKPEDRLATPAELAAALKGFVTGCSLERLLDQPALTAAASPGPASRTGLGELLPLLDAELDVVFWDASRHERLSINEPGVLPVKKGDEFRKEVRLNRPADIYLVWIDSTGKVAPVYPWKVASDWEEGSAPKALGRLEMPAGGEVWPINGPAGVETLVLLAREEPLTAEERSRPAWLPARFPRMAALPDPSRPRWLTCREEECLSSRPWQKGFDARPRPLADPLFQIDSLLRNRLAAASSWSAPSASPTRAREETTRETVRSCCDPC